MWSMKKIRIQPKTVITVILMAAVLLLVFHIALDRMRKLYMDQIYLSVLEKSRNFLENTVENLVLDIDREEEEKVAHYEKRVEEEKQRLKDALKGSGNPLQYTDSLADHGDWTILAYNADDNHVLYDPKGFLGDAWDGDLSSLEDSFVAEETIREGKTVIICGISRATVHSQVQADISGKIRSYKFIEDAALWVNEVRDYSGGENYAVRLVDSAEPGKEKRLLSTEAKDASGKQPLAQELSGIKNGGSVFYTLDEKDKDRGIRQRLVFARHYAPYSWVICMGTSAGEMGEYAEAARKQADQVLFRYEIGLSLIFIMLLFGMSSILLHTDRSYTAEKENKLQQQVEWDALTHANTRAFGIEKLEEVFKSYQKGRMSPALMILDVDHFKEINDTYGHDAGDAALRRVVTALYHAIRSTDHLVRWGGDEFIGIYPGLKRQYLEDFAMKIEKAVHTVELKIGEKNIKLTASIGFAYFEPEDQSYMDGLKRADDALYLSKENGRNQFHIAPAGGYAPEDRPNKPEEFKEPAKDGE